MIPLRKQFNLAYFVVLADGVEVCRGTWRQVKSAAEALRRDGKAPEYRDADGRVLTPLIIRKMAMERDMKLAGEQRKLPEKYYYSKKVQFK